MRPVLLAAITLLAAALCAPATAAGCGGGAVPTFSFSAPLAISGGHSFAAVPVEFRQRVRTVQRFNAPVVETFRVPVVQQFNVHPQEFVLRQRARVRSRGGLSLNIGW